MKLFRDLNLRSVVIISGITAISLVAIADEATPDTLVSAITGKDATSWAGLQRYGLKIGGWATAGINYNTDKLLMMMDDALTRLCWALTPLCSFKTVRLAVIHKFHNTTVCSWQIFSLSFCESSSLVTPHKKLSSMVVK